MNMLTLGRWSKPRKAGGRKEETTNSLHLRKEQGHVLDSEILSRPHP